MSQYQILIYFNANNHITALLYLNMRLQYYLWSIQCSYRRIKCNLRLQLRSPSNRSFLTDIRIYVLLSRR
jgi:hypothetical protein